MSRYVKGGCVVFDDDFPGFSSANFVLSPRYDKYLESILVPNGMIKDRVEKMASEIINVFDANGARSINIVCILKGGFKFASELSEKIQNALVARKKYMSVYIDFIVASTYINDDVGHETHLRACLDPTKFRNKDLLIVEDLIDTGTTMIKLVSYLNTFNPRSIYVASLLVKRRPDCTGFQPHFVGFEVPNRFIVGYAIDYNDQFRDLPHICSINEEGKKRFAVSDKSSKSSDM